MQTNKQTNQVIKKPNLIRRLLNRLQSITSWIEVKYKSLFLRHVSYVEKNDNVSFCDRSNHNLPAGIAFLVKSKSNLFFFKDYLIYVDLKKINAFKQSGYYINLDRSTKNNIENALKNPGKGILKIKLPTITVNKIEKLQKAFKSLMPKRTSERDIQSITNALNKAKIYTLEGITRVKALLPPHASRKKIEKTINFITALKRWGLTEYSSYKEYRAQLQFFSKKYHPDKNSDPQAEKIMKSIYASKNIMQIYFKNSTKNPKRVE